MGLFDKVKKILFDEEEIDDLPVRTDKPEETEKKEEKLFRDFKEDKKGGVIIHNDEEESKHESYVDEDTITEVKVPVETPKSFAFPIMMDDEDEEIEELPMRETLRESAQDTQQLRLQEDEFDRTKEIERLREERLNKTREDVINEYNEIRRAQRENREVRETVEPRRENLNIPEKKEKVPYKVPPVISPVFGVLDKNYDPDEYEQTRQKITLTNAGNTSALGERQFGPVSYNDQGIPAPKYHSQTVIITTQSPSELIKDELKRESENMKVASQIEKEIIDNIINDKIDSKVIEDAFDDTKEITATEVVNDLPEEKPMTVTEVEEPTIEYDESLYEDDDNDAVITGSPYDEIFEEEKEEIKPKKSIKDLIDEQEEAEEADITPDAPKNIEDNVDLDDTIETDLYNLIDSMYKDDE